jgi:hypothetical protein
VIATCEACGHKADVNVDALPETIVVPKPADDPDAANAEEADRDETCVAYIVTVIAAFARRRPSTTVARLRQGPRREFC